MAEGRLLFRYRKKAAINIIIQSASRLTPSDQLDETCKIIENADIKTALNMLVR
jgi:hypothetical protein